MSDLSSTPEPPYYAVIFMSWLAAVHEGYEQYSIRIARVEEVR